MFPQVMGMLRCWWLVAVGVGALDTIMEVEEEAVVCWLTPHMRWRPIYRWWLLSAAAAHPVRGVVIRRSVRWSPSAEVRVAIKA